MSQWIVLARAAAALNVLLLAGLAVIWARNYRQFRSKHTLGLAVFALLLLGENAFAVYFYMLDPVLSDWFSGGPPTAWRAMMLLNGLELAGILFLTWVTWD